MQQLRLGYLPRAMPGAGSRVLLAVVGLLLALGAGAVALFVMLPLVGIIVSAAVGGVILTLAGLVMMVPFLLVSAGVVLVLGRPSIMRRHS